MQVDAPPEDNDNNEEEPYIVENPSLVSAVSNVLLNLVVKRKGILSKTLVLKIFCSFENNLLHFADMAVTFFQTSFGWLMWIMRKRCCLLNITGDQIVFQYLHSLVNAVTAHEPYF